jgi:hypothetical protein
VDLTADTITGAEVATGSIGPDELATDSVLNAKIKDSVVTKTKIASDAIAASEVRDGSLTAKDVGKSAGTVTPTFTSLAAGACASEDIAVPDNPLTNTVVFVGSPADGVVAGGRPSANGGLRLTACNLTAAPVNVSAFPYVAFAL